MWIENMYDATCDTIDLTQMIDVTCHIDYLMQIISATWDTIELMAMVIETTFNTNEIVQLGDINTTNDMIGYLLYLILPHLVNHTCMALPYPSADSLDPMDLFYTFDVSKIIPKNMLKLLYMNFKPFLVYITKLGDITSFPS